MMKVSLFIPCYIDQLYPKVGWDTYQLLTKLGCEVSYQEEQTCCGYPSWSCGRKEITKPVAEKWIVDFSKSNDAYIVSPSSSCVSMIKNYYGEMFANSSYHLKMKAAQGKLYELSQFIDEILHPNIINADVPKKAVYLDSCYALRESHIYQAPRNVLSKITGLQLIDSPLASTCCGFGGLFAGDYDNISIEMAKNKIDNILSVGAECIISADMVCLMHLKGYIEKNNISLECFHIAEILNDNL